MGNKAIGLRSYKEIRPLGGPGIRIDSWLSFWEACLYPIP